MNTLVSEEELRWKCRRGMLELDLLLNGFLECSYHTLDAQKLRTFLQLLEYPDQTLHDLLIVGVTSTDNEITALISHIQKSIKF